VLKETRFAVVFTGACALAFGQLAPPPPYQLILSGNQLFPPFDLGINTSAGKTDWLFPENGQFRLGFPGGAWGAFFITVGPPVNASRPGLDISHLDSLEVEMRGEVDGRTIEIGIKDNTMPDDGREAKQSWSLTREWQVRTFPLSGFGGLKAKQIYVALEVVFDGSGPQTVYLRNARFVKSGARACKRPDELTRSWWTADKKDAVDVTGASNGGAEGVIQYGNGISSSAFEFSSGTVSIPALSRLRFDPAKSLTIDLWFRRLDPAPAQYIMGRGDGCTSSLSSLQLAIGPSDFPSSAIAMNTWSHLALGISGAVATFYVNGVPVNKRPLVYQDVLAPWRIGGVGSCVRARSMIDEVVITDRALAQLDLYDLIDRRENQRCKGGIDSAVNSASLIPVSPSLSFVSLFGSDLSAVSASANSPRLPQRLGDIKEVVVINAGGESKAGLAFVSPQQVNLVMPSQLPSVDSILVLRRDGHPPKSFAIKPQPVAPGMFTMNGDGKGVPAGFVLSVSPTGQPDQQPLFERPRPQDPFVPKPFPIATSGSTYLILYGTGVRLWQKGVEAFVGDQNVPVLYSREQGEFDGLDQVNLGPLPLALSGRGIVPVRLLVDGVESNPVSISIR